MRCVLVKVRILSAGIGIFLTFLILIFYETLVLNFSVSAICSIMVYEIFRMTKIYDKSVFSFIVSEIYAFVFPFLNIGEILDWRLILTMLYFICLLLVLLKNHEKIRVSELIFCVSFCLCTIHFMTNIIYIRDNFSPYSLYYILLFLFISWLCDIGAYFVGTRFGKNKLAPKISPNKTVEGVLGGVAFAIVSMVAYNFVFLAVIYSDIHVNFIALFVIILIGIVFSILGDLVASIIKRQYKIKDFGSIMPGHGGILDRFDSLILVSAILYPIIRIFPIINK